MQNKQTHHEHTTILSHFLCKGSTNTTTFNVQPDCIRITTWT